MNANKPEPDWLAELVKRTNATESAEDTAFTARVVAGLPERVGRARRVHSPLVDVVLASLGAGAGALVFAAHSDALVSLFDHPLAGNAAAHFIMALAPCALVWGFSYLAFESLRPDSASI